MSRWDNDMNEISRIQFHTDYSQTKKNELIAKIEWRMQVEEEKELFTL